MKSMRSILRHETHLRNKIVKSRRHPSGAEHQVSGDRSPECLMGEHRALLPKEDFTHKGSR